MIIELKYILPTKNKPSRIKIKSDYGGKEYELPAKLNAKERAIWLLKQYKRDKNISGRLILSDCLSCAILKRKSIEI